MKKIILITILLLSVVVANSQSITAFAGIKFDMKIADVEKIIDGYNKNIYFKLDNYCFIPTLQKSIFSNDSLKVLALFTSIDYYSYKNVIASITNHFVR